MGLLRADRRLVVRAAWCPESPVKSGIVLRANRVHVARHLDIDHDDETHQEVSR